MEKTEFTESMKNIPTPKLHNFVILLMDKTIQFVKRLRWKAFFFDKGNQTTEDVEKFGFNSTKNPPSNKHLENFEKDLFNIVRNIEFKKESNNFQKNMKKQILEIQNSDKVYIKADKSTNIYKLPPEQYDELKRDTVTKQYKLDKKNATIKRINNDTYECANELKISDRMGFLKQTESYLLLKDHKNDFLNKKQVRLINPAKTELGKVSKIIIQNIVCKLKEKLNYNLWINTREAINWFVEMKHKKSATFIQFDIMDYYPSISEKLLDSAIALAKEHVDITDQQVKIIKLCRTSVLFHKNQTWIKSNTNNGFDTPMGAFDSAQISDLVGIYILNFLTRSIKSETVGLYRDDGLLILKKSNGPKATLFHKRLINAFKLLNLKVEVVSNVKEVNFLDVTLNLQNGSYRPYKKDNQMPRYVNANSNHPKAILKHIPTSINKRLNTNSSNKDIFEQSKKVYEEALERNGHNCKLKYIGKEEEDNNKTNKPKHRRRKIIWYNPPFCKLTNINIGRAFIELIKKHFTSDHPLHKIINKNSVKISYCCTRNIDQIISSHNKNIMRKYYESKNKEEPKIKSCTS